MHGPMEIWIYALGFNGSSCCQSFLKNTTIGSLPFVIMNKSDDILKELCRKK